MTAGQHSLSALAFCSTLAALLLLLSSPAAKGAIDNNEANTVEVLRSEIEPDGSLVPELIAEYSYHRHRNSNNDEKPKRAGDAVDADARAAVDPYAAVPDQNPCTTHKCEAGQTCIINENDLTFTPVCVCMPECPTGGDVSAVCSNFNTSYTSDCELYRQRCLCQRHLPGCTETNNADLNIDYMTACKEIPECTDKEMSDFPHRMAEWLFIVMRELAQREELSSAFAKLERKAQRMYEPGSDRPVPAHPILWKFCDLDHDPNDRYISRVELMELELPLKSMESCLVPFLDDCDVNNDHKISLAEWGKCLKLNDDEIEDICNFNG